MAKIKILVCCHKQCEIPRDPVYLPIQVGSALQNYDLGIQKDNEVNGNHCENISVLNPVFSEMTAVYWAWKNMDAFDPEVEYIGLCHYRRFFYCKGSFKDSLLRRRKSRVLCTARFLKRHWDYSLYQELNCISSLNDPRMISSTEKLKAIIPEYDIVTTFPVELVGYNVETHFRLENVFPELLGEILYDVYPEYFAYYQAIMKGKRFSCANMVVMKKEIYKQYCSFIFDVLFRHIDLLKQRGILADPYHETAFSRGAGYLAEILSYVFVKKMEADGMKVAYTDKLFLES